MKIERALDWDKVSNDLLMQLNTLRYNADLRLMLKNINGMVTDLSKLEVSFRRTRKYSIIEDKLSDINNAIDHLEKLILMAKLMD